MWKKRAVGLAAVMLVTNGYTAKAAQFVTVLDMTINVDRIAYIQPIFCESGIDNIFGSCSFSVVFAGDYTATATKTGQQASYSAREKVQIVIPWDNGKPITSSKDYQRPAMAPAQDQAEAMRLLRSLRELLPR